MAAAAAVAVLGGSALWVRHEHALAGRVPSPPARVSLAVVAIHSEEPGGAGLDAATQEAIATELASGDQLRVVPSAAVSQAMRDLKLTSAAKLGPSEIAMLGQRLGVDYVLEESATAKPDSSGVGSRLHLAASLDRVRGQQHMSSQSLDTSLNELDTATQQIAVSVARVLPLKRTFSASPSLLPHQAEAVRLYAKGLEALQALEPVTAQVAFSQAAVLEPRSPLIHVALARSWDMLGYRQRATDEAAKSISLVTGLPTRTKVAVEAERDQAPMACGHHRVQDPARV